MKIALDPRRRLLAGTAFAALSMAAAATPAMAVVPNETTNSEEIVDAEDEFRGVGMFFRADGFVCSGTLINPRTVLFAAHCVNDIPEDAYHVDGIPAAWSFNVNALPGFQAWFSNFASNPSLGVFNVNRIFYDQRSLQNPQALGFIEADVALASLDTPAAGIPTWALLFTTLPAPESIDPVTGTGYHVNIVGYGSTGTAATGGSAGIDFRRRAAENMLGAFASLDDSDAVLFGPADPFLPQNLYQLDFDSQNRNFLTDINQFRDDALPNEGTTAGGDSGGPLILDAANNTLSTEDLVIGVLSGGSRVFNVPFSSIGTTSFYQPLSLYWQYIVENNPYRYVSVKAGNGNWEDATHWQTDLDPMYRIINAEGQVVNGLPTTPELGLNGTEGDFGAVCVEFEDPDDFCVDLATGEETSTFVPPAEEGTAPTATGTVANNRAQVSLDAITGSEVTALPAEVASLDGTASTAGRLPGGSRSQVQAQMEGEGAILPTPTLANGLPGATGFVPDNIDAVTTAEVRVDPRYFDVTLSQTGTTTLSSDVTIDRLTIRNNAGLTVGAEGDLTSLIDINQFGGRVNVDGGITSVGDYTLFAGMLEGTGTVTTPFLTSITGVFSPGTMGTTGTLTVDGNLVMSSGTQFNVDRGSGGTSDRLDVSGIANVGGIVNIGMGVTQRVNGRGERYTIVTGGEGISGTFTERSLSAILQQTFTYEANAVLMEINAASYTTVVDDSSSAQVAYARLFDQNRDNDALASLYALDFESADTIRSTFTGLAPVNEQAVRSIAAQSVNMLQNFNDARLREADKATAEGKIAISGRPLDLAQMSLSPAGAPLGGALMAMQDGAEETEMREANLPENLGMFLSGGYITANADSLPGYAEEIDITGYFITGGIEFYPGENTMVGLSGYYNTLEADVPLGQRVDSDTYAASLYTRHAFEGGPVIDGQFSMGNVRLDTQRSVQFLGTPQTLESSSDDLLISGALGISYDLKSSFGTISPGFEARFASVDLGAVRETGGTVALSVARETFESKQARFGFDYEKRGSMVAINANAQLVWEFEDGPQLLGANFASGVGPNANFVLDTADHTWGEVGISATVGNGPLQLTVGADTTIGRDNADAQVFRGTATYRF